MVVNKQVVPIGRVMCESVQAFDDMKPMFKGITCDFRTVGVNIDVIKAVRVHGMFNNVFI